MKDAEGNPGFIPEQPQAGGRVSGVDPFEDFKAWHAGHHGAPETLRRKNARYVARLVKRHTEPVLRGLLRALARLKQPLCAAMLSDHDLANEPLDGLIDAFGFGGLSFQIVSVVDAVYTVEIDMSFGHVGDGGRIEIVRTGDSYQAREAEILWMT